MKHLLFTLLVLVFAVPNIAQAAITADLTASRVTGTAPLYVFFDATGTTHSTLTSPWRDLLFNFDFDDLDGGSVWTNTGYSKNQAWGSTAAHVFLTAGTYVVEVTIEDPDGDTTTATVQVVVTSGDTTWATTNTVCVSTSGTFTGCPSGATQIASSDSDAQILTYGAQSRRILFRGGETFTHNASTKMTGQYPLHIGAYGTGRAIFNATSAIVKFGDYNDGSSSLHAADIRITDIYFDGNNTTEGMYTDGVVSNLLVMGNKFRNVEAGIKINRSVLNQVTSGHIMFHKIGIFGNDIADIFPGSGNYSIFAAAREMAIVDNILATTLTGEPTFRIQHWDRGVLQHNKMTGDQHATKSVVKFHSCKWVESYQPCSGEYSEYIVISDNQFYGKGNGSWIVEISPQTDTATDERIRRITYERNYHETSACTPTCSNYTSQGVAFHAGDSVLRDSIFNMTGGRYMDGIQVSKRPNDFAWPPDVTNVHVYNNTFYTGTLVEDDFWGVDYSTPAFSGSVAQNNLMYTLGGYTNQGVAKDMETSGGNIDETGNGTPFIVATPSVPAEFELVSGPITNSNESLSYLGYDQTRRPNFTEVGAWSEGGALPTVDTPTISPNGGTFTSAPSSDITLNIASVVEDAICYTTDGSTPAWNGTICTTGTKYTATFNVSTTKTVKTKGFLVDYNDSAVASAVFTLDFIDADVVTFDNGTGSYETSVTVTLSTVTPATYTIYYGLNSDPVTTEYTTPLLINVDGTVIHAYTAKAGYDDSAETQATYTITEAAPPPSSGVRNTRAHSVDDKRRRD